jgi:hypothetical protein
MNSYHISFIMRIHELLQAKHNPIHYMLAVLAVQYPLVVLLSILFF